MGDGYDAITVNVTLFRVTPRSLRHTTKTLRAIAADNGLTPTELQQLVTYECMTAIQGLLKYGWLLCDGRRTPVQAAVTIPIIDEHQIDDASVVAKNAYDRFHNDRDVDRVQAAVATLLSGALQRTESWVLQVASECAVLAPRVVPLH
jgi:hypothetical protein